MSQILKGIQDLLPASPPNPPLPRAIARIVKARREGAVLYYDFEGRVLLPPPLRSKVIDKSGHGNNGVLKNDAHIENGSLVLDGKDDLVRVPDSDSLDITREITVSFWIRWSEAPDGSPIRKQGGGNGWGLNMGGDRRMIAYILKSGSGTTFKTNTVFEAGKRYYVVFRFSDPDNSAGIFVNGAVDKSIDITQGLGTNDRLVLIGDGSWMTGNYVNGSIDELCIRDAILSREKIKENYNKGK